MVARSVASGFSKFFHFFLLAFATEVQRPILIATHLAALQHLGTFTRHGGFLGTEGLTRTDRLLVNLVDNILQVALFTRFLLLYFRYGFEALF